MPLDPQAQALLDQAVDATPIDRLSPEEARRNMLTQMEALGPPEPVKDSQDRTIPGPAGELPIRIYTPLGDAPRGALVFFHGGGWVIGSVATHDGLCRALANAGQCLVVSVEYRLSPEHPYPAAAEDAYAATRWVSEHAAELKVEPSRIGVAGDSAGGNLAAVVALMARDRGGPSLACQVLIYPITDSDLDTPSYRDYADGYFLTRGVMAWFWNHYLGSQDRAQEPYIAPLRAASLAGLPPAFVITAECDPLCDEGDAYAARLEKEGVAVAWKRYPGMIHGFLRRYAALDQGRQALDHVAETLRGHLGR